MSDLKWIVPISSYYIIVLQIIIVHIDFLIIQKYSLSNRPITTRKVVHETTTETNIFFK